MARARKFSAAQKRYMVARAAFETARQHYNEHEKIYTAEANKLHGTDDAFPILPEDHPVAVKAQALLDVYNATLKETHAAASAMFDWALDTTFARMGTPQQKRDIRAAFEDIKKMSHVQKIWIDAVDCTLKLAA